MKISQIVDKKIDQNEIESKYIWCYTSRSMSQINLSTLVAGISWTFLDGFYMIPYMALPNDQIYGFGVKSRSEGFQYEFIIDENANIKRIQIPKTINKYFTNFFTSCYYEDSIFTFKYGSDFNYKCISNLAKRYSISQDKWISLCPLPFNSPVSCIGFNQKILISANASEASGLWVYDIILDSYSHSILNKKIAQNCPRKMFKSNGKVYCIIFYEIYATEDPFSEWMLVYNYLDRVLNLNFPIKVLYEGSIYYLRDSSFLYQFNLSKFTPKAVADLNSICANAKNQKILH